MLLSELAKRLGLPLQGKDCEFTALNTLQAATVHDVSFLANPKYTRLLSTTKACAVIVLPEFADKVPGAALISDFPYMDFARAASLFVKPQGEFSGISPQANIHSSAMLGDECIVYPHVFIGPRSMLGKRCHIYPGAYIGEDCQIGDDCIIYPNAVILAGVSIGTRSVIGSGAVLGADGFGFTRLGNDVHEIPQIGSVILGDGVNIGPNSCIDKATLGATTINSNTKVDNLVQVGHNVHVGEQCFLVAQVGIAGSTEIGNRVTIAGQVGVSGHLSIGDDVTIGAQAGVAKSIAAGTTGSGSPFMETSIFRRHAVISPRLPEIYRRLQQVEKELANLKNTMAEKDDKEHS